MLSKRKLYIASDSKDGMQDIDGWYYLISDSGEMLCSHFCSDKSWAKYDLIERDLDKESCDIKYGKDNWEVVFLGEDDMTYEKLILMSNEKDH